MRLEKAGLLDALDLKASSEIGSPGSKV